MSRLDSLAELFGEYNIYPAATIHQKNTPFSIFREMFSHGDSLDRYRNDVQRLLDKQSNSHTNRGADLPWWGQHYFDDQNGFRIMIIGPQSQAPDAGSVVFFFHLLEHFKSPLVYEEYLSRLDTPWLFPYRTWNQLRNQLDEWRIDLDFLYVTDAGKVYQGGSRSRVDMHQSKSLLEREIEICKPDLVILLGDFSLKLLKDDIDYPSVVDQGEYITIGQYRTVVSPFPAGQGYTQRNFHTRLNHAARLISEAMEQWNR